MSAVANPISDKEHVKIVTDTASSKVRAQAGLGTNRTSLLSMSKDMKRSVQALFTERMIHDKAVQEKGYCPICKRAGGILYRRLSMILRIPTRRE